MGDELNAAVLILESETEADDDERLTVGCAATEMLFSRDVVTKRWATKLADGVLNATLDVGDDASTANHLRVKLPMT